MTYANIPLKAAAILPDAFQYRMPRSDVALAEEACIIAW